MGKILLPGGRWNKQPQYQVKLDRKNQLAKTITHYLPLNGDNREIVTGAVLTRGTAASTLVDVRGKSLKSAGAAACASVPIDLSSYTKASVSFWMWWDVFADDDALALEYTPNFQTDGNAGFLIDPNSGAPNTGLFAAGIGSFSGTSISNVCTFSRPSAAVWRHHVFNFDRTTGTGLSTSVYLDGVPISVSASGSPANVADNFTNSSLYLFSRNNASLFGAGRMQNLTIRGGYLMTAQEAREEYTNPWQIFQPQQREIYVDVASGTITANADITQASNTSDSTSALTLAADASITASSDTASSAAVISIAADASITAAGDTSSSASVLSITADASMSQSGDTATADGATVISADCSATQADNTLTSAAALVADTITANASITQADNTPTADGALLIAADTAVTQASNTTDSASALLLSAAADITQTGDTLASIAALASDTITANADITQAGNTSSADGILAVVAGAALTQDGNTITFDSVLLLAAFADITQAGNTLTAASSGNSWLGESFAFPSPITRTFDFASPI